METKKFAIEQAVRLVSTMSIENKTKAVFDLAKEIVIYVDKPNDSYSAYLKMTTLEQTE